MKYLLYLLIQLEGEVLIQTNILSSRAENFFRRMEGFTYLTYRKV